MVPKDANGNYAVVEKGTAKWTTSDEAVLTITPDGDGLTATGEAIAQGVATVTATADASLEPNLTTEITAVTNIGVQDAEAMSLEIVVGYMPQPGGGGGGGNYPSHPIYWPPYPSTGPGFPTNPIQLPPWAGGPQPPFPGGGQPVYPSHPIYWPPYPSTGPGFPTNPIQLPPWAGGNQPEIDNTLPGSQTRPDQGLPPTAAPKK
jgi:hypothetical protein